MRTGTNAGTWIGLRASRIPGVQFGPLRVEMLDDQVTGRSWWQRLMQRRLWAPTERVVVQYHGLSLVVPAGRVTDFASVPRPVQWLLSERSIYSYAAVIHDWLYFLGLFSRPVCDAVFLELLKAGGVGAFDRWAMYLTVRVCGGSAWDRHRRLGHPEHNEGVF